LPARRAEARIQLGARISEAKYRQLKLAAVLRGVTVQTLVEHAIQDFLTNHPELLHSSPTPRSGRNHRRAGHASRASTAGVLTRRDLGGIAPRTAA
jgi:hypothetical protein